MDKKVILFPISVQPAGKVAIPPPSRIILRIGQQRIAFDISCQVTELPPPPEPVVISPEKNAVRKKRRRKTL
jgi:hypothetical protein